ncbi:MAG: 3'(2'),5'-bisphosphate nucleotidase CysQ [Actinomycetota bacterium]|nr:3'(2'),5'-bisphosphate nucleotidase CysQ [Actinomycetota bacterium]
MEDTSEDARLAAEIAESAGRLLIELREQAFRGEYDPRELGKIGDSSSDLFIRQQLEQLRPDDAILSEEELKSDLRRHSVDRVWIVDPLDGTREFGMTGRVDWAVHVALWDRRADSIDGRPGDLVAGAVALPAQGVTLETSYAKRTQFDDKRRPIILVSQSRPPAWAEYVATAIDGVLVGMGSAGAKCAEVILGRADAYLHAGGQYEWDSAAPAIVARKAGLHVSRIDGTPLTYNHEDPYSPDLAICRTDLWPKIFSALLEGGALE